MSAAALAPSMADRDGKIWMDGQMVDWRDAKIHVLTHTLHYGCGASRVYVPITRSMARPSSACKNTPSASFNSAKILRMKIPFTQGTGQSGAN
jgi:branched-chain amino acid aminotransferase